MSTAVATASAPASPSTPAEQPPPKSFARRKFDSTCAHIAFQWNFSNTLQNTPCYTVCAVLKTVIEIPKHVATGGFVYAGLSLGANLLGVPSLQKGISWGSSMLIGAAGSGIGALADKA